jgi:repressor LexA
MNTNRHGLPVRLTEKQKQFYESLQRMIEKNGESPTVSELVRLMKLSSPRAASQYLESLEKKGLIERRRYEARGIRLLSPKRTGRNDAGEIIGIATINIPVIASAGCDQMAIYAQRNFGDYICVATELLQGVKKDNVVCIKAVGDSMVDAGINPGDYVLVEMTEDVHDNELVVAIIDSFAVIKKIEIASNAVILRPVSSDPQYMPIILKRDFQIFGRVIDVIRLKIKTQEMEIVPLFRGPEEERMEWTSI